VGEPKLIPPPARDQIYAWTLATTHLYSLGIGVPAEDDFLCDSNERAFPTFATVMALEAGLNVDNLDLKYEGVVLARLRMTFTGKIAPSGTANVRSELECLVDLAERGSEVWISTIIRGSSFTATVHQALRARLDGHRGSFGVPLDALPSIPQTQTYETMEVADNLAHIFRHLGDRNPLHVDASAARTAGFPRPILHGQLVLGLIARRLGVGRANQFMLDVRFVGPAFAGLPLRLGTVAMPHGVGFRCLDGERRVAEGVCRHS
jgi:acyl dehydratase